MQYFKDIAYLKTGNSRQKKAYTELKRLQIFEILKKYNPILTGTIPIAIDLPESDLDIICQCKDHPEFSALLLKAFGSQKAFEIHTLELKGITSTIATFKTKSFDIEIFGQNIPPHHQNAYKHMLIEHHMLNIKGPGFRDQIKALKAAGLKTEPAFAKLLGLPGDPYEALLRLEI